MDFLKKEFFIFRPLPKVDKYACSAKARGHSNQGSSISL